jgi:hypothetical protein
MEAVFWFIFGTVVGMASMPHLQQIAEQVRRRLAEFDQPKDPSPRP